MDLTLARACVPVPERYQLDVVVVHFPTCLSGLSSLHPHECRQPCWYHDTEYEQSDAVHVTVPEVLVPQFLSSTSTIGLTQAVG
jgi:hypothetical protein